MKKQLSITISDYAYNRVFSETSIKNKSGRIEELMLKGQDNETGEQPAIFERLHKAEKTINEKNEEINKLKLLNGSLKEKLNIDRIHKPTITDLRIEEIQKENNIIMETCKNCQGKYNTINKCCPYCKHPNLNYHAHAGVDS
jgi:hypothetical protein